MTLRRSAACLVAVALATTGCSAGGPSTAPAASEAATGSAPAGADTAAASGRRVQVRDLWFDATEVTIGQFATFVTRTTLRTAAEREGGGYEFVSGWNRRPGWSYLRPYGAPADGNQPAVHLSWDEARGYCRWAGGRLPTVDEWRTAAYTETRANPPAPFRPGETYTYPTGSGSERANTRGDDRFATAAPVGSFPAGVNGLHDMGGNVWEWLDAAQDDSRLVAGGSWWYGPEQMTAGAFQYKEATFYAVYVGFRCVYDTPPAAAAAG